MPTSWQGAGPNGLEEFGAAERRQEAGIRNLDRQIACVICVDQTCEGERRKPSYYVARTELDVEVESRIVVDGDDGGAVCSARDASIDFRARGIGDLHFDDSVGR